MIMTDLVDTAWKHSHLFDTGNPLAERKTKWALLLTLVMMVAEISGGYVFNSMALLADGWHMSSHAMALGLSVLAYVFARRHARDMRFAFGAWKIEILGGYTSALLLVGVAALMLYQSVMRLIQPVHIHYTQAISLALLGLSVNLACAWLLKDGQHGHHHDHHHGIANEHGHAHLSEGVDLNLRAAYVHVIADAATSVLAIAALIIGKFWGADWLDPVMGIAGACVVSIWAVGLLRASGKVLMDAEMDAPVVQEIRDALGHSTLNAELTDLHVWRVAQGKYACIVALAATGDVAPDDVRQLLSVHEELVHVTVEINHSKNALVRG